MKKKLVSASLLSLSLLRLTSCETDSRSGSISDKVGSALPNLWISLAQLAAFLVRVVIFFVFAYKPIKKKMQQRADYVASNIKESEQAKEAVSNSEQICQDTIRHGKTEASRIIQAASKTAKESADQIVQKANDQADAIREQAKKDAEQIKQDSLKQTHDEIVNGAISASKAILKRELSKEDNDKVVDDFLSERKKEEKNG